MTAIVQTGRNPGKPNVMNRRHSDTGGGIPVSNVGRHQ
jgi:hypothetical protein